MTFDKQVKEAKSKRLENRIIRDVVFILLGILFLVISFIISYKNDKKEIQDNKKTTTTKIYKKTNK